MLFFLLLGSCTTELVLRPSVEGVVCDNNGKPIKNVSITFLDCYRSDCVGEKKTATKKDGSFFLQKQSVSYFILKPAKENRSIYSSVIVFEKKEYKEDTIDIRKINKKYKIQLDTIFLKPQ